jgi:predicted RNA-binding Zn ribbon-like protein
MAFDLSAGRLCLDFVNTLAQDGDQLGTYDDLVAFGTATGQLSAADADDLLDLAREQPRHAEGIMVRARRVRAALRRISTQLLAARALDPVDLSTINFELAAGLGHRRVLPQPGPPNTFAWGWVGRPIDRPLWAIVSDAAELLVGDERDRIRECGASDCQWLFLDTTRNRSRQWCSMTACGNRAKARRHYARARTRVAAAGPPSPSAGAAS